MALYRIDGKDGEGNEASVIVEAPSHDNALAIGRRCGVEPESARRATESEIETIPMGAPTEEAQPDCIARAKAGDLEAIKSLGPISIANGELKRGQRMHPGYLAILPPIGLVFVDLTPGRSLVHQLCGMDDAIQSAAVKGLMGKRLEVNAGGQSIAVTLAPMDKNAKARLTTFVAKAPGAKLRDLQSLLLG